MHCGNAAAMPPAKNAATLSFCQASRSVRITNAILVSNCMGYLSTVIPGHAKHEPGISRFSDVQLHIAVRCFASPRNDCQENHPLASQAQARITHSLPPN